MPGHSLTGQWRFTKVDPSPASPSTCFPRSVQLGKVKSTVHLTGKQSELTKDALQRLLEPPPDSWVSYVAC